LNFLNPPSEHGQKWLKSRLCVIAGSGQVELVGTVDDSSDGSELGSTLGINEASKDGIEDGFEDLLSLGFELGVVEGSEDRVAWVLT
jgi:hypothetical protein